MTMVINGKPAKEWLERLTQMTKEEYKTYLLNQAEKVTNNYIKWIAERPNNQWIVYSFCKHLGELAELTGKEFSQLSFPDKVRIVRDQLIYVEPEALIEGVQEYHDSIWCRNINKQREEVIC